MSMSQEEFDTIHPGKLIDNLSPHLPRTLPPAELPPWCPRPSQLKYEARTAADKLQAIRERLGLIKARQPLTGPTVDACMAIVEAELNDR